MEDKESFAESESETGSTVDLSRRMLKKIERASNEQRNAVVLVVNDNEISKLDNLESYTNLKKLSLENNQIIRMYGVSQLLHLEVLDLTNNSLVTIEGLKELKNLKELYLGKNKIKIIEHLNNNLNLEKLDISENNISHISDISHLHTLKELYLHGNKLTHLRQCERYFPENIEILTLHNNLICDLNEVSHLVQFNFIKELSFSGNPCVDFASNQQAFNYRPFIKNWCSSLVVLDYQPLDDIECLKAEWLYSQGRGRSFKVGEQAALVDYLANVCPPKERNDETEDVKKLKLILSKAQQHQKQLKEQLSTGIHAAQSANKISRKKKLMGLPERMVTSYQDCLSKNRRNSPDLMTRSLDSGISRNSPKIKSDRGEPHQTPLQTSTTFIPIPDSLISPDVCHKGSSSFLGSPVRASSISSRTSKSSSRNSPHSTPESKRKPSTLSVRKHVDHSSQVSLKKQPNETARLPNSRSGNPLGPQFGAQATTYMNVKGTAAKATEVRCRGTSDEDDGGMFNPHSRSKTTQKRVSRKCWEVEQYQCQEEEAPLKAKEEILKDKTRLEQFADSRAWNAAVCIQRRWRGYRARNLNRKVLTICKDIQLSRMQEYITKVMSEMEATRIALEGNRKLQMLQMQAINAIWKKIVTVHPKEPAENSNESALTLRELMLTCSNLNKQVEGLQNMMKGLQNSQVSCQSAPISTQTEIIAVHTPQGSDKESFPYFSSSLKPETEDPSLPCQGREEYLLPRSPENVTETCTNSDVTDEKEEKCPALLQEVCSDIPNATESTERSSECPHEHSDVQSGKVS